MKGSSDPDKKLQGRLERWAVFLLASVVVIAGLVLTGWQWDIESLQHPFLRAAAMNPLTALFFLFSGISFFLLREPLLREPHVLGPEQDLGQQKTGPSQRKLIAGYGLACLVLLGIGYPGIGNYTGDTVNRIPFMTAGCFVLSSCCLLLMRSKGPGGQLAAHVLAILLFFLSLFSILGFLYRVKEFHVVFSYPLFMAVHTAICFALFSLGYLFAQPGKGLMKDFTTTLSGSIHARLFIPVAIFVPVVLGLLRLYGYWTGLFSTEFGVTVLVLSIIIVFLWPIRYTTLLLNKRDLQNRKAAQDLLASENQLGLVVNSIRDYAIYMLDESGIVISWNKGAEAIKGYKAEEIIGQSISAFYSKEDVDKGEPAYNLGMAKAYGHHNCEGWRIRKDGTRFWADVVFTAIYDPQGQLKGFAKVTRDRTDFKKAQEQIAYQARLMEDTSDAVYSIDQNFHILSWNKAAEQLYGYSAQEAIGAAITGIARSPMPNEVREAIRSQLLKRGHWTGEVVNLHKNGTPLYLLLSASITQDKQGKIGGYVMVCRDISERKRAEEQLRQFNQELEEQVRKKTAELLIVFERVSDGFMAFDKTGNITYVNKKAAELNQLRPEDLVGKNFWKLFPSATGNEFGENFHRAIRTQQNIHFEMFSPSLQLWIECYMYPSTDGLSFFFRDITENRKAKETISRSNEELRQLASHLQNIREEERAAIAREIHDELGQQLTGIKMDLDWISRKWDKPEEDIRLQKIKDTLGLLDHTIKTVRRIATELRPSVLDDLGLIAAIEWQSQEFQRRSGINVVFRSSLGEFNFEPAVGIGLFRICQESLTNVARHSEARNVWIDLDWADENLVLSIRDDGQGLAGRDEGKKTLGLLGMKERALMMGGRLELRSEQGAGLTLEAIIPIKAPII